MSIQRRLLSKGGGKRKGFGWRKGTDQNVKTLGKFGERLAQHILGGVRSRENDGDCDLWLDELDVGIESKVGSSRDGIKVRIDQLDSHLKLTAACFPYSRFWYVFLKYQNWGRNSNGERCRLFQEMVHSESEVSVFLRKNTVALYVLDISIVNAIRNKQERKVEVWRPQGNLPALLIGWRFFDQLRNEPEEVFRVLNLDFRNYRLDSRQVQVRFEDCQMNFRFLALLKIDVFPKRGGKLFQLGKESLVNV